MGDDIQAIKAGILETGDIFIINKADREGADKTMSDLKLMINMDKKKYAGGKWKPPILKTQAVFDKGVSEFLEEIEKHRQYLIRTSGELQFRRKKNRVREELTDMLKKRLIEEVLENLTETGQFDQAVDSIVEGKIDPYSACDNLVLPAIGVFSGEPVKS
jgi:LAO/AO transport system kinase